MKLAIELDLDSSLKMPIGLRNLRATGMFMSPFDTATYFSSSFDGSRAVSRPDST